VFEEGAEEGWHKVHIEEIYRKAIEGWENVQ
jgi:hypothetical protein